MTFKKAFSSLALLDSNYKYAPSLQGWKMVETICKLKISYHAMVFGSNYLISNLMLSRYVETRIQILMGHLTRHQDRVPSHVSGQDYHAIVPTF